MDLRLIHRMIGEIRRSNKYIVSILVLGWFLVGLVLVWIFSLLNFYFHEYPWGYMQWVAGHWGILAAIGTWMLALGVIYGGYQLLQVRLSTNAPLVGDLYKDLRSESTLKTIRYIYGFQTPLTHKQVLGMHDKYYLDEVDKKKDKKKSDKDAISEVLDLHDMLGALARHGLVSKDLALEANVGGSVLRCWYQLHDYVRKERSYRGTNYLENFEDFANRALEYVNEHKRLFPGQEWLWFFPGENRTETNRINIREKLNQNYMKPMPFRKQKVVAP